MEWIKKKKKKEALWQFLKNHISLLQRKDKIQKL